MEISMKDMNENLLELKKDVELIKNILISEEELNEDVKKELGEARGRVEKGEYYKEEEAKDILNL